MMTTRTLLLLGLVSGALACAKSRGFDREKRDIDLSRAALVTEDDIRKALELRPQLPKSFRLGIRFNQPRTDRYSPGWTWQPEDKDALLRAGENLKRKEIVSEVAYVSAAIAGGDEVKASRYAAAQHGVDAVLIVSGVAATDRY